MGYAGGMLEDYGPHKTLYNRWKRWSDKGVFARMLLELASQSSETGTLMIDATHLKAHRTASCSLQSGAQMFYPGSEVSELVPHLMPQLHFENQVVQGGTLG